MLIRRATMVVGCLLLCMAERVYSMMLPPRAGKLSTPYTCEVHELPSAEIECVVDYDDDNDPWFVQVMSDGAPTMVGTFAYFEVTCHFLLSTSKTIKPTLIKRI